MRQETAAWADGFGVWRVSVAMTGSRHRDAMRARKRLLAELSERGNVDPRAVKVARERVTNHGTAVYVEV